MVLVVFSVVGFGNYVWNLEVVGGMGTGRGDPGDGTTSILGQSRLPVVRDGRFRRDSVCSGVIVSDRVVLVFRRLIFNFSFYYLRPKKFCLLIKFQILYTIHNIIQNL